MLKKIVHATFVNRGKTFSNHTIVIDDGRITDIFQSAGEEDRNFDGEIIDAEGLLLAPGMIDIHIHGCMGADTMDANPNALNTMSNYLVRHGITLFYATTVTNTEANITSALENIALQKEKMPGSNLAGAHIEGPYINPKYKGAQNPQFLRVPRNKEYHSWINNGTVKLITIAPELKGMDELIRYCRQNDVEMAVGHSDATYDQVKHAADLGLRQATHLFNGMQGLHHREPGTVGGVLGDPRIYAQIITDGIHLHPAIVDLVIKVKGIDHTILISDSIRASGLADGDYDLGGQTVTVVNGSARIANGSLAGSTLVLDQAVRNTMKFSGLDFPTIIQMATSVPAAAMNIADRKGAVEINHDADLVFFDKQYQVAATMVNGMIKYKMNLEFGAEKCQN